MKYTQNLNMKIPEGGDPIDILDITGNFETLDEEVNKKASSSGGDISNTTIKTVDTIADSFPVPSAGESSKTFLGKVKKALQDMKDFSTGVVTLGRLVNNGQTTEPGFALDARYGKTLYDLYAQLNSNLNTLDAAAAKTTVANNFKANVGVESSNMGTVTPGINLVARTDNNPASRPSIALDCHGTISGIIYLDLDGSLKFIRGADTYTIDLTKIN